MRTKLILHNCKNYEVTEENPRNFKIGDIFYFSWRGITDIQIVDSESILNEVNGTIEEQKDCIDLTHNFWQCVKKVIIH